MYGSHLNSSQGIDRKKRSIRLIDIPVLHNSSSSLLASGNVSGCFTSSSGLLNVADGSFSPASSLTPCAWLRLLEGPESILFRKEFSSELCRLARCFFNGLPTKFTGSESILDASEPGAAAAPCNGVDDFDDTGGVSLGPVAALVSVFLSEDTSSDECCRLSCQVLVSINGRILLPRRSFSYLNLTNTLR